MRKRERWLSGFIIALYHFCSLALPATAQQVTYSGLYHDGDFSRAIDLSRPVGAIEGTVSVTPSGAASYVIPIQCPPGTKDMVPGLSLVYNSQSGNGVLGMGWSLSGLSVITRAGKDLYHDREAAPPGYTNADAFVLDGQRLAVTGGSNGINGSTYRTESESYSLITAYGSYGTGGGPEWFRVLTKEGTVMDYGNTPDARTLTNDGSRVMIWRLNRIQDVHGNYLSFRYTNDNNGADPVSNPGNPGRDYQLAELRYTGNVNTGLVPYNKLSFSYSIRGDKNTLYSAGNSIESRYVLTGIRISAEADAVFKSYVFTYANETGSYSGAPTYLRSVEERSAGSALNTTIFKYGQQPDAFTVTATDIPVAVNSTNSIHAGDYTGDGVADILKETVSGSTYTIYKKEGSGYVIHGSTGTISGSRLSFNSKGYLSATTSRGFVSSDYNGDNIDDILGLKIELRGVLVPPGTMAFLQFYAGTTIKYPADGSTAMTSDSIAGPAGIPLLYKDKLLIPGDFDGDQRMDYFNVLNSYDDGSPDYYLALSFPKKGIHNKVLVQGSTGAADLITSFKFAAADQLYVIDYDGDGSSEVMITDDAHFTVYRFQEMPSGNYQATETGSGPYPTGAYHKILALGDFNDDGITDIITKMRVAPYTAEIGYGTGKGFARVAFPFQRPYQERCDWDPGPRPLTAKGDDIYVADFNGDGRSDIFHLKRNCNHLYDSRTNFDVYYSTGTGFTYKTYDYGKRVAEEVRPCAGDFNGDGRADIAFMIRDDAVADPKLQLLFLGKDGKERLLEKITDGFNRTTQISYETIARGKGVFYTKGAGATYPVNNVQLASWVVTDIRQPDGTGGTASSRYAYENQLWHRCGKGFLGFERVRSLDVNTDVRTESVYGLYAPLQLPYLKATNTTLQTAGIALSATSYAYRFNNSGWLYAQQCTASVTTELMKGNAVTEQTNAFDSWGNVTVNVTRVSATGIEPEITTTHTAYTAAGSRIPNKASAITVTSTRGLNPAVAKPVTISYKPNGLVAQYREYPSGSETSFTEYDYDRYGNVIYETRKPNDPYSLYAPFNPETRYVYDNKGRFVTETINGLGHSEKISWHPLWAKPLREETISGVVTEYEYDDWGRLIKTKYPGPYEVTNSVAWGGGPGILYTSWLQHPGAPDEKHYYDLLGRVVKKETEAFGAGWARSLSVYDHKGRLQSSTNMHLPSETPLTTTNTYDHYGNIRSITNDFGTTRYAYEYDRGIVTTSVTDPAGQLQVTRKDANGRVLETRDNGGSLKFTYDSRGNQKLVTNGHAVYLSKEYNALGQLVQQTDQDAGRTFYTYNPFGVQITETDAEGVVTRQDYLDKLGRLTQKRVGAYITTYTYHGPEQENNLAERKTTGPDGLTADRTDYNNKGELIRELRTSPGARLEKAYNYDSYGQLSTIDYSSGLRLKRYYDANGYLERIQTNFSGGGPGERTLFKAISGNGLGQYTSFIRDNGDGSAIDYYHGIPTRYYTPGLQDLRLTYDHANGNLTERRDANLGVWESFTYDNLNRLTSSTVHGPGAARPAIHVSYDRPFWGSRGNITSKTDAGDYGYSGNQVVQIKKPAATISHEQQTITYKPFRKAGLIREPKPGPGPLQEQSYVYNGEEERVYSQYSEGGLLKEQRWYFDDLELQMRGSGPGRFIHYIPGGGDLATIVITEAGAHTYYTVYTDHLGSVVKVTDEAGIVVADLNYNAWGRERKAISWDYPAAAARPSWLYRGYTGHEMLPQFGLIDMNGRMYDPVNGRMLRPDNYIQDPLFSQNYNRYSYCLNNPLKYTDPSGDQYVGLSNHGFSNTYSYAGAYNGIPYAAAYNHSFYSFSNSYTATINNGFTNTAYTDWIGNTDKSGSFNVSFGPWSAAYSHSFKTSWSGSFSAFGPLAQDVARTYTAYSYHATTRVVAGIRHKPTFEGTSLSGTPAGTAYDEFIIGLSPISALPNFLSKTFTGRSILGYEMQPGSVFEMVGPPAARVGAGQGGLNLFKFTKPHTKATEGWKTGDRMLKLFDQGSPKLNWKQNSGLLRQEMRSNNLIFDSYRYPSGKRIPAEGFLNAERKLLESRGWIYYRSIGAYRPPF